MHILCMIFSYKCFLFNALSMDKVSISYLFPSQDIKQDIIPRYHTFFLLKYQTFFHTLSKLFFFYFFKKKTLWPLFMDGVQLASRLEPLWGGSLLFTTKFPEITGTHFIDLGRMKGWVDLRATQWFWTRDPWIGNPAIQALGTLTTSKYKAMADR